MIRIVVGGQIDKEKIADMIKEIGADKVVVSVKSDIEAAMAIKTGQADYYLGACHTGGGGALAMAIALLGMGLCTTVSMPGTMKSEAEIIQEVNNGKKAFGFTPQHAEQVIPIILKKILS
jgi:threonine dehydrogenase-like Zn-dependent dehydrogenase